MNFWNRCSNVLKAIPLWSITIGLGTVFLGIGIFEGQISDIYKKAVMICLECIGIG